MWRTELPGQRAIRRLAIEAVGPGRRIGRLSNRVLEIHGASGYEAAVLKAAVTAKQQADNPTSLERWCAD